MNVSTCPMVSIICVWKLGGGGISRPRGGGESRNRNGGGASCCEFEVIILISLFAVGVCSTAVERRTADPAAGDRLPTCAPLA